MSEPLRTVEQQKRLKKPNFLLIVILAGVAILLVFLAAYILLSDDGRKLLPGHQPDRHPTSMLIQPVAAPTAPRA